MQEAIAARKDVVENVMELGNATSLKPGQRLLRQWYPELRDAIQDELNKIQVWRSVCGCQDPVFSRLYRVIGGCEG